MEFGEGFIEEDSPAPAAAALSSSMPAAIVSRQDQHKEQVGQSGSQRSGTDTANPATSRPTVQLDESSGIPSGPLAPLVADREPRDSNSSGVRSKSGTPTAAAAPRRKYTVPKHLFQPPDPVPVASTSSAKSQSPAPSRISAGASPNPEQQPSTKTLLERRGLPSPSIEVPARRSYNFGTVPVEGQFFQVDGRESGRRPLGARAGMMPASSAPAPKVPYPDGPMGFYYGPGDRPVDPFYATDGHPGGHLAAASPSTATPGSAFASTSARPLFPGALQNQQPYSPNTFSQMNARYAAPTSQIYTYPGQYLDWQYATVNGPDRPTANKTVNGDEQSAARRAQEQIHMADQQGWQIFRANAQPQAPPVPAPLDTMHGRPVVSIQSQYAAPSQRVARPQLAPQSSSATIDLTADGDDDNTTNQSSDEEVTITGEKIPLKPPKETGGSDDEDDELQMVGEKPSERSSPLCIGQLTGVALILYPLPELRQTPDTPNAPLQVALLRTQPQVRPNGTKDETIKLYSGATATNFGIVEQRLANVLGPMMTRDNKRGLGIWIEAWVKRTNEKSPYMLPLQMLLFCHPHIVPNISSALEKSVVYLEHPITYDPAMHSGFKYYNPHNTSSAGNEADRRRQHVLSTYNGTGGGYQYGRFGAAGQAAKNVEVKREQVEEMFKTIQSGADLGEVEPDAMVTTKLYPHQKQALAFLLDRERLRSIPDVKSKRAKQSADDKMSKEEEEEMIALWRPARDVYGRFVGWHNVITEVEIGSDKPPPQCRGAILADDMGLGKTIVIISLVANTLSAARQFAELPVTKERKTEESFDALAVHPSGSKAGASTVQQAQFKSAIPGISNNANMPSSSQNGSKSKKKGNKTTKTQLKREEHEVARLKKLVARSRATLIVCPLSTVMNWESQIEEHIGLTGGAVLTRKATRAKADSKSGTSTPQSGLSVYIYHGTDRNTDSESLANFDVVITTYATLGSEYSKQVKKDIQDEEGSESSDGGIEEVDADGNALKAKGKKRKCRRIEGDATSPLQQIEWFRIVLDEAHQIKEHNTIQAHAACELAAERRVCLTGTPLQNSLSDLFSLMRFLKLEPFTDKSIWTAYIGTPAKLGDPLGVSRLKLLMRHLALRRTKQSTDKQGKPILSIPPKKEEVRYLSLDDQESAFYTSHHRRYKHNFEVLEKTDSVMKNYCSILQEVLRLRQICAHMALVRDSEDRAMASDGTDGDIVAAITKYGISRPRALRLLALLRDTGAAQCVECDKELASPGLNPGQDDMEEDEKPKAKRARKRQPKKLDNGNGKLDSEDNNVDPSALCPVLTRCQHLYCLPCFQKHVAANFPDAVSANEKVTCSVCRDEISPVVDVVQVSATEIDTLNVDANSDSSDDGKVVGKRKADRLIEHSTKIRALASDLFAFSQNNPASVNYAGDAADLTLCEPDEEYRPKPKEAIKTVVFSQWTSLLDRIEDALGEAKIKYTRLDGGMHRTDRNKALSTFKADMSCEVLLVSLRAGGVGLNLTHASRVYMMEPSWNPSVEHQAIDRIHRLGQTRPVRCIRFIMEKTIESNMLEIQERKQKLANMSLGQTLSKAELAQQRREDLRTLFK